MSEQTVPFKEKAVRMYLDRCINYWRNRRDFEDDEEADHYIDAFQKVRISLFGKPLSGDMKDGI